MSQDKVVESLRMLYEWQRANGNTMEASSGNDWLNPAQPLTEAQLRHLAEAVYNVMRRDLRQERERHEGW